MTHYTLSIAQAAEDDLRTAFNWYEEKQEALGRRFADHVNDAFNKIVENPNQFQVRYRNIRICFLEAFPFGIHYRVQADEILVIAVFHTSQNPEKWQKRSDP